MKIYNLDFQEGFDPCFLGKTKPGFDGFGSTGVTTTKKLKRDPDSSMIVLTNKKAATASDEYDLQITSEKAVMAVNDKIIIDE